MQTLPARSDSVNVFLRAMRASDLDLLVESENLSLMNPWSKRIFSDCLRAGYECWVLATRDRIVAHGVLSVGAEEAGAGAMADECSDICWTKAIARTPECAFWK